MKARAQTLVVIECWCGISLAIPDSLDRTSRQTGTPLYCPLGHEFTYAETENDELKSEIKETRRKLTVEIDRRKLAERQLSEMSFVAPDKSDVPVSVVEQP